MKTNSLITIITRFFFIYFNWKAIFNHNNRFYLSSICAEAFLLTFYSLQSLLYLPFAIANALTARLNDGYALKNYFALVISMINLIFDYPTLLESSYL